MEKDRTVGARLRRIQNTEYKYRLQNIVPSPSILDFTVFGSETQVIGKKFYLLKQKSSSGVTYCLYSAILPFPIAINNFL